MGVEDLDQLGEIGERAGQPVDLVDHDDIDPARPHLGEQRLQGRAVERGAGQAAIIIVLGLQSPALTALAADIKFVSDMPSHAVSLRSLCVLYMWTMEYRGIDCAVRAR